ncbi:MAG: carbohydrate ABC transporter permease [Chloroflexi bacterium]|nr:carbohydrate ABC transporter permease [Chloroflexota bacterium]
MAIAKPVRHARTSAVGVLIEVVKYTLLIGLAFSFFVPFLWMISSALKDDPQIYTVPPIWLPSPMHPENFINGWTKFNFTKFAANSIVRYAIPSTILVTLSSAVVAYGFSRLRWHGRDLLFGLCLATIMIPFQVVMVPLFITFKTLGWLNSYMPLVIPGIFGSPWFIFMLRQFFLTIPEELSDAARIDGAGEIGILFRIVLPLARPALIVVALFQFLGAWNDYLGPLLYINKEDLFPLALGIGILRRMTGETGTTALVYPYLMAVSTIITVPIIIAYFLAQRRFIEGITTTGMKG